MSFLFNQTCLSEGLLPNYIYFKVHDPVDHNDTDTGKYRSSLVRRQINYNKEKNILSRAQDNFGKFIYQLQLAQSARAVEYTDWISAEG